MYPEHPLWWRPLAGPYCVTHRVLGTDYMAMYVMCLGETSENVCLQLVNCANSLDARLDVMCSPPASSLVICTLYNPRLRPRALYYM